MSKPFNKNTILYPPTVVPFIAEKGELKYFVLWLKLKRRHISGHSHSFMSKPSWYPGSKETYRRHLNKMIELGWVKRDNKGFRLISLKKLYKLEYIKHNNIQDESQIEISFNRFVSINNDSFQNLLYEFQKIVVRTNYDQQIYNITDFVVKLQKIHCEKLKEKYKKHLLKYNFKHVCRLADLERSNRTNLSSKGLGKLFGKSSGFGHQFMHKLIDDKFIIRQVQTKYIPVSAALHKQFDSTVYYSTFISKGKMYKKKTSIMLTSYLKENEIEQYQGIKQRRKEREKKEKERLENLKKLSLPNKSPFSNYHFCNSNFLYSSEKEMNQLKRNIANIANTLNSLKEQHNLL